MTHTKQMKALFECKDKHGKLGPSCRQSEASGALKHGSPLPYQVLNKPQGTCKTAKVECPIRAKRLVLSVIKLMRVRYVLVELFVQFVC